MYQNILVPLDGSEFAERAIPLALSIAERTDGNVQLVSAVPTLPPLVPSAESEGPVKGWFEEERLRASEYLEELQERLKGTTQVQVHVRVVSGDPVQALEERVRKTDADAIVMTTHGKGLVERVWLGSVADGLVRRAPCPILLQRLEDEDGDADLAARHEIKRILTPLDGSGASEDVVPDAVALARAFDARIALVRVVADGLPIGSTYIPHAAEEERERAEAVREAREALERTAASIRDQGVVVEVAIVQDDDPGAGILRHRGDIGADLVAMTTRGRGGVTRLVLGSVADRVIRSGVVPVLVHRRGDEGARG